ncbi:MAG: hypothetical protein ACR2MA_04080 [Egibacteraceae bacterium]
MRRRTSGLPVAMTLAALVLAGVLLDGSPSQGPRAPLALTSGLLGIGLAGAISRISRGGREQSRSDPEPPAAAAPPPDAASAPADAIAGTMSPVEHEPAAHAASWEAPGERELLMRVAARQLPLVERVLGVLDELEESERDAEHLAELFVLDQLVTRMRRDAEVLLVLGGRSASSVGGPVPLLAVMRAALAEVAEFDAISLGRIPTVAVRAELAAPLSHLVAEVIDAAAPDETAALRVDERCEGESLAVTVTGVRGGADLAVAHALAARLEVELDTTDPSRVTLNLPAGALVHPAACAAPTSPAGPAPHVLDTLPARQTGSPQQTERPVARVGGSGQRLVARPARRLAQERDS